MSNDPFAPRSFVPRTSVCEVNQNFRVDSVESALDALDLIRPPDFAFGVLALFLDSDRKPAAAVAVQGAPAAEICLVGESVVRALQTADPTNSRWQKCHGIDAVVFGIVRAGNEYVWDPGPDSQRSIVLEPNELHSWLECQHLLATSGIGSPFLLVLEPQAWAVFPEPVSDG